MSNPLEGLNIVHPPPPPSTEPSNRELLSTPPGFPDLAAQLNFWTNLNFASDEPFIDPHRQEEDILSIKLPDPVLITSPDSPPMKHELISKTDKPLSAFPDLENPSNRPPSFMPNGASPPFDLGNFLSGLGIDPFLVPPQPSIEADFTSLNPSSISPRGDISTGTSDMDPQPPKRARAARKSSIVTPPSAVSTSGPDVTRAVSELSDDHDPLSTPVTAAEDKRRRNTAASARFRAKKKEREQAMERRSKDLENRVNELERECEGLRRENGWLKGLVVGVTSGNPPSSGVPPPPSSTEETKPQESGKKRKRDSTDSTDE